MYTSWLTHLLIMITMDMFSSLRIWLGKVFRIKTACYFFYQPSASCGTFAILTLSQWSSSGLPVAIQCTWKLNSSVHWNATGEIIVDSQCASSVLPVVSSGFPVVFQCVPVMQINTGSPLGYHWRLASASVVPVASQCTCGSSGLQCVPIKQINTGSPLEHHWVLASASVVPVASQCTCGSSGLPVWSVQ